MQSPAIFVTTRLYLLLVAVCVISMGCSSQHKTSTTSMYIASNNPMQDVQDGLEAAKASQKLFLLVMGAQWCHDSTALADNFQNVAIASQLDSDYHISFVDVAYFKNLSDITQRFGQAHYFATPTVMIINPQTEQIINEKDMHIWGAAASIGLDEYKSYFAAYANTPQLSPKVIPAQHVEAIARFEQNNAARLTRAYALISPNLKKATDSNVDSDEFISQWKEIRQYRMSLQKDIFSLRQQAINSPDKVLNFPVYPGFSWESPQNKPR